METITRFAVQTFANTDGRLVPSRWIDAASAAEATAMAGAMVPTMPGAVALEIVEDRYGKIWSVSALAVVGTVPDGWAEELTV